MEGFALSEVEILDDTQSQPVSDDDSQAEIATPQTDASEGFALNEVEILDGAPAQQGFDETVTAANIEEQTQIADLGINDAIQEANTITDGEQVRDANELQTVDLGNNGASL